MPEAGQTRVGCHSHLPGDKVGCPDQQCVDSILTLTDTASNLEKQHQHPGSRTSKDPQCDSKGLEFCETKNSKAGDHGKTEVQYHRNLNMKS